MREILAYHPEVVVQRGRERHVITADVPDWMSDGEFLAAAARSLGVSTAGEVVQSLERGSDLSSLGFKNVEVARRETPNSGAVDWNQRVV